MRQVCTLLFSAVLTCFLANATAARAEEKVLTLGNGIDATLNVPDGVTTAPAVLMLHGFWQSKE